MNFEDFVDSCSEIENDESRTYWLFKVTREHDSYWIYYRCEPVMLALSLTELKAILRALYKVLKIEYRVEVNE